MTFSCKPREPFAGFINIPVRKLVSALFPYVCHVRSRLRKQLRQLGDTIGSDDGIEFS